MFKFKGTDFTSSTERICVLWIKGTDALSCTNRTYKPWTRRKWAAATKHIPTTSTLSDSITASTTAASTAGAVYDTAASDASLADITGLTGRTTARVDTGAAGQGRIHLKNNHVESG